MTATGPPATDRRSSASPFGFKLLAAKADVFWARRRRKPSGHAPGERLIELEPNAIGRLGERLTRGAALITGTNGKTTTATLAADVVRRGGIRPVHNELGDNMDGGVATSLLIAARLRGGIKGDIGVFEVDEPCLQRVSDQLHPRVILLGNLFRDRYDRFGQMQMVADQWGKLLTDLKQPSAVVLNADDPLVATLGEGLANAIYYGIEDRSLPQDVTPRLPAPEQGLDVKRCSRCGSGLQFDIRFLSQLGHYSCNGCGLRRPRPHVYVQSVVLRGGSATQLRLCNPEGTRDICLRLPGLHNVYNALGAAALGTALGIGLDDIAAALETAAPTWGRGERFTARRRRVTLTYLKNPVGANAIIRALTGEADSFDVLGVVGPQVHHGQDVSWLWDADFEALAPHVGSVTCSGLYGGELALRLKYAGVPRERIVIEPDVAAGLERALTMSSGRVHALCTSTSALYGLRAALLKRQSLRGRLELTLRTLRS